MTSEKDPTEIEQTRTILSSSVVEVAVTKESKMESEKKLRKFLDRAFHDTRIQASVSASWEGSEDEVRVRYFFPRSVHEKF